MNAQSEMIPDAANAPHARVYRGKPEKQRDPRAQNAHRPRANNPPRDGNPQSGEKSQTRQQPPRPTLNKPSLLNENSKGKHNTASGNPADGSVFRDQIAIRETRQKPSAPALIEISRMTYAELLTDDAQLGKSILPEYLDYYATAMLWFRIVKLKQKNSQPLSDVEQQVLTLIQTTTFSVPDPIFLQLRQLGNIVTKTGQHLYTEFPPLLRK